MKQVLKWRRFANFAEIQRESLAALDSISVEDFRQYFQQWEHCSDRCIRSQGLYSEWGLKVQTCTNILNKSL
jgi:hypothetical protein